MDESAETTWRADPPSLLGPKPGLRRLGRVLFWVGALLLALAFFRIVPRTVWWIGIGLWAIPLVVGFNRHRMWTVPRDLLRPRPGHVIFSTPFRKRPLPWFANVLLVPFLMAGVGAIVYTLAFLWWVGPNYYADVDEIRQLAETIPGVEVLEVTGNHDLTLEEPYWLIVRHRGVAVYFHDVSAASFDHWTPGLDVLLIGDWALHHRVYENEEQVADGLIGESGPNFGRGGGFAELMDPPPGSIPDFLVRIDEVIAILDEVPSDAPGTRYDTADGRIHFLRRWPEGEHRWLSRFVNSGLR